MLPDRDTAAFEFAASESMERLPLAAPADFGAKLTVSVTLLPASIAMGKVGAGLRLKLAPVTLTWLTVMFWLLEGLLNTRELVLLLPTDTLPRFSEFAPITRFGLPVELTDFVAVPVPPPQPTSSSVVRISNRR